MKVLFLNPHVGSDHQVVKGLQAKGMAVLVAANGQEAWQILGLHGSNLDLVVVHREDAPEQDNEGGFKFLARIKATPVYSDLPAIVSSHRWKDADFARHQESPQGANAYIQWPFDTAALYSLIQAVFAGNLPSSDASRMLLPDAPPSGATRVNLSPPPKPRATSPSGSGELVLEDASSLFGRNAWQERSDTSIRLEMPETDPSVSMAALPLTPPPAPLSEFTPSASNDAPIDSPPGVLLESFSGLISPPAAEIDIASVASTRRELPEDSAKTTVGIGGGDEHSDGRTTVQGGFDHADFEVPEASGVSLILAPEPEPEFKSNAEGDTDAAQDMPYLFGGGSQRGPTFSSSSSSTTHAFARPLGDAVVPGGAAQAPDVETLKKYLLLREQDVAVLSSQLKSTKDQVKSIDEQLRIERGRNSELSHVTSEQRRKLDEFEKEKKQALDTLQGEVTEIRFQLKAKTDKARILDSQVREAVEETERLKERVRADIRKIRVREKELENRLEIMKKDSEALIAARENKIIELKRKLDLLEFNLDLLQDQHSREKENASKLRERLAKAAQVVRVAGGLLDNPASASQLAAALASEDGGDGGGKDSKHEEVA